MKTARFDEIDALLRDASPRGFRAECRDLLRAARDLCTSQDILAARLSPDGPYYLPDPSAGSVVYRCENVAAFAPGAVHADAARHLRALINAARVTADALADHAATVAALTAEIAALKAAVPAVTG